MLKFVVLACIGSSVAVGVSGQIKKQFSVEKTEQCNQVELRLYAKTGNCFIRPSQNDDILNIYSNQDVDEYAHSFSNELKGSTCVVDLSLEQDGQRGVSQKISYNLFGSSSERPSDKFWKVYLTESTDYSLDLDYGLGNANIDLSGLSIHKLKINTISADVNITYSGQQNKIDMDTFSVKVDMGSLHARQINMARSKVVLADVGFGNMYLDFSDKPKVNNHIIGKVGAGNLVIQLPSDDVPVIVTINDSWLCSVNLSKTLKKVAPNKYANDAYTKDSKNALVFDLDVSMGKIVFR